MKVRHPLATLLIVFAAPVAAQNLGPWPQHALDRPQPPVVMPAPADKPGAPPADAVVLFDGSDLSQWENDSGAAAGWTLGPGYVEVAPGAGNIVSADKNLDITDRVVSRLKATPASAAVSSRTTRRVPATFLQPPDAWESRPMRKDMRSM